MRLRKKLLIAGGAVSLGLPVIVLSIDVFGSYFINKSCLTDSTPEEKIAACTERLEDGVNHDPGLFNIFLNRGLAYSSLKQYDKAEQDLNQVIQIDPKNYLGYGARGEFFNSQRQYNKALPDLNQAIALNAKNARLYNDRGGIYVIQGKYDLARLDFTKATEVDPGNFIAYRLRALSYELTGDYDQARKDIDKASQLASTAGPEEKYKTLVSSAYLRLLMGQFSQAIAEYDQLIATKPSHYNFELRGIAKFAGVSLAAAIDDLTKAVSLDPKNTYDVIWLHLAHLRAGQDDVQEFAKNSRAATPSEWETSELAFMNGKMLAAELLNQSIKLDPGMQKNQLCQANVYIGEVLLAKDKNAATQHFKVATQDCPFTMTEREMAHVALSSMPAH